MHKKKWIAACLGPRYGLETCISPDAFEAEGTSKDCGEYQTSSVSEFNGLMAETVAAMGQKEADAYLDEFDEGGVVAFTEDDIGSADAVQ